MKKIYIFLVSTAFIVSSCNEPVKETTTPLDPLPSWNAGTAKENIINFVSASIDESNPAFIPVEERIATFDNDGTLWAEQPIYFQVFFIHDRVKAMAADHPEWDTLAPYSFALKDSLNGIAASGMNGLMTLLAATHSGMTQEEFSKLVTDWGNSAKHPTLDKYYTELVYQPMLELLTYLQDNDFKTYVVSGGGVDFMRPLVSMIYRLTRANYRINHKNHLFLQ